MPSESYQPAPLDTSGISLPPEIELLLERLAENVHDVWARQRLDEGWRYGPERNDSLKTHPCLVPFAELTDQEKEYDRKTAKETLLQIMSLGYTIELDPERLDSTMNERLERLRVEHLRTELDKELDNPGGASLPEIWKRCAGINGCDLGKELLLKLADKALKGGELWVCGEVLARGCGRDAQDGDEAETDAAAGLRSFQAGFRSDSKVRLLRARWLTQTGHFTAARALLAELIAAGRRDGETLGLLGRTRKDEWEWARRRLQQAAAAATDEDSQRRLREAAELEKNALDACRRAYEEAFDDAPDNYYPGINAATMSLLAGRQDDAERLAKDVIKLCEKEIADKKIGRNVWNVPSLAEAYAVLGDKEKAAELYREGACDPKAGLRDVCTTRKQARLIAKWHGWEPHALDDCFGLPPVVIFAGHRLDDDRESPRFPAAIESQVAEGIRSEIAELRKRVQDRFGLIAYGSVAAGSDILFGESLVADGAGKAPAELHLVLSSPQDDFVKSNVTYAGADWEDRCRRLLAVAGETAVVNPHQPVTESQTYSYVEEVMVGMARMKADFLGLDLVPVAVWDGQPSDGPGGTQDFVNYWRGAKIEPRIIEPKPPGAGKQTRSFAPGRSGSHRLQQVKGILFADVKGFSRLSEEQVPVFVDRFMGEVSRVVAQSAYQPEVLNTWGDALYMVFGSVQDAGMLALELQEALCPKPHGRAEWSKHRLPDLLNVRFSVHAGPVFPVTDPVVRQLSFTGRHSTLAARLEPVTPPGQIFVSQEFAALAYLERCHGFSCVYLGRVNLAKSYYQDLPVYQLLRQA